MKKILIMIFVLALCLSGCGNVNTDDKKEEPPKQVIVFPSEETTATLNGYKNSAQVEAENKIEYIGNSNSKKFHLPDCRYASNIKEENIEKSHNRNYMINQGYSPCQNCKP